MAAPVRIQPQTGRQGYGVETSAERKARMVLTSRLGEVQVSRRFVARHLGISHVALSRLLRGEWRTNRALGYDQWATRIGEWLDDYEKSLAIMQRHAAQAVAEVEADGLPLPPQLMACLPEKPRGRRVAR